MRACRFDMRNAFGQFLKQHADFQPGQLIAVNMMTMRALQPAQRDRVHRLVDTELHNTYGPTETTVTVSHWSADAGDDSDPLPIGHAVWNTRLYVLDEHREKLPPGQVGQLPRVDRVGGGHDP